MIVGIADYETNPNFRQKNSARGFGLVKRDFAITEADVYEYPACQALF